MHKYLLLLGACAVLSSGCTAAYKATAEGQYDWTDRYPGVGRLKEVKRRVLPMREVSGLTWDPVNKGLWMVNDGRRLKVAFLKDPMGADMFDADAHDLSKFELPRSREMAWKEWPDFEAIDVEHSDGKTWLWIASEIERQAWRFDLETKKVDNVVPLPRPIGDEGTPTECAGTPANRSTEGLAVVAGAEGRTFFSANERCPAEIVRKEEKPDRLIRLTQTQIERSVTEYMLASWKPPVQEEGVKPRSAALGERYLCPAVPRQEAINYGRYCKTGSIGDITWQESEKRLWVLLRHSRIVIAIDWRDKPRVDGIWSFLGKVNESGSSVRFGNAEGLAIIPPDPANDFKGALFIATDPGNNVDSELVGFELPEMPVIDPARRRSAQTPQN